VTVPRPHIASWPRAIFVDGGDDERRGREEKIPILDRSGQSRRSAPCPIRVGDGNSGFFTEGAERGEREAPAVRLARWQLAQQLWRAGKQRRRLFTRRAVIYSPPPPPSPRAIYIYRQNSRRRFGVCIQPRQCPIPFNIPPSVRPSARPFARDSRRTERAFCAA